MRRRHLNIRGKSANLPAITEKDWLDLQFGVDVGVDYYALSFVRSADVIYELKAYLAKQGKRTHGNLAPCTITLNAAGCFSTAVQLPVAWLLAGFWCTACYSSGGKVHQLPLGSQVLL